MITEPKSNFVDFNFLQCYKPLNPAEVPMLQTRAAPTKCFDPMLAWQKHIDFLAYGDVRCAVSQWFFILLLNGNEGI
jgi:hypothetical protein